MFGLGKDKGNTHSFEYRDSFAVDPSGHLRRTGNEDATAETFQLIADSFHALGDEFDLRAQAVRHHKQSTIDAHVFDAMVSGS